MPKDQRFEYEEWKGNGEVEKMNDRGPDVEDEEPQNLNTVFLG